MTLATTLSRLQYSPNGVAVEFAFPYYFLEDEHLRVILTSAAGVETLQTLNSDYTVTGAGDLAGGSITFTSAPASGTTLTISRVVPITQLVDYIANDNFPAETHEMALDKITMILQQLADSAEGLLARALLLPETEPATTNNVLPAQPDRALEIVGFEADGDVTTFALSDLSIPDIDNTLVALGSPAGTSTTKTVTVRVSTENFLVKAWLVDVNQISLERTVTPPDGNNIADYEEISDALGDVVFTFTHTGPQDTWYLVIDISGNLQLSNAITLGT